MRNILLFLALLGAAAPAQAQQAGRLEPGAVRASQLRDASDEELVRLFFGPMRTFPYVTNRDRSGLPSARLWTAVWFNGAMQASDYPGICRSDRLVVGLRATAGGTLQDPLFQPVGFEVVPVYFIENREEAMSGRYAEGRDAYQRRVACEAMDPRDWGGVPAHGAFYLVQAMQLVGRLGEEARAGRAPAPLDCSHMNWNGPPPADEAACLAELAVLRADDVAWVSPCLHYREAPGGCIQVHTSRWFVDFDKNSNQSLRRIVVHGFEDLSQAH